jgi:hypothetical protein
MKTKMAVSAAALLAALAVEASADPLYNVQTIGLTDASHTSPGGVSSNYAIGVNAADQILGETAAYSDSTSIGDDFWIYTPAMNSYQFVGLTDSMHIQPNGRHSNYIVGLDDAGDVVGGATTFSGGTFAGNDAWVYLASTRTTQVVGLTGSAHLSPYGSYDNTAVAINSGGDIIGNSMNAQDGYDAWLYSPLSNTTIQLGIPITVQGQGAGTGHAMAINNAGQAVGYSSAGAWIYSPNTGTKQLPGTGSSSEALLINSSGQVAGLSAASPTGTIAWLYSPTGGATKSISPPLTVDAPPDGWLSNSPFAVNDAGYVLGSRYTVSSSGQDVGEDVWLYSPATGSTKILGLTSATYLDSYGYDENEPLKLTSTGFVAGTSGSSYPISFGIAYGTTGWVYDPRTNLTYTLPQEGDGYVSIEYLGDDGTVIYSYQFSDGTEVAAGDLYRWTESSGAIQLGALASGGLSSAGLADISYIGGANANGQLVGYGDTLGGSGTAAVILTPVAVPEPTSIYVLSIGLLGLLGRRRATTCGLPEASDLPA